MYITETRRDPKQFLNLHPSLDDYRTALDLIVCRDREISWLRRDVWASIRGEQPPVVVIRAERGCGSSHLVVAALAEHAEEGISVVAAPNWHGGPAVVVVDQLVNSDLVERLADATNEGAVVVVAAERFWPVDRAAQQFFLSPLDPAGCQAAYRRHLEYFGRPSIFVDEYIERCARSSIAEMFVSMYSVRPLYGIE
jgi:hypothetical protein